MRTEAPAPPAAAAPREPGVRIIEGDALAVLRTLESESVQCVVTSPPYMGLRSYGTNPQTWGGNPDHEHTWEAMRSPGSRSSDTKPGPLQHAGNTGRERLSSGLCVCGAWRGELGLEPTPALFVAHLVDIFREVKRVLRNDGLCFVNLGDSYSSNPGKDHAERGALANGSLSGKRSWAQSRPPGIKPKDLMLIPERFAIAMQDDGWYVRSRIAWCKTSAMPESVRDRPTSAWEHVWMFSKQARYYYDAEAVRQPSTSPEQEAHNQRYAKVYAAHDLSAANRQPGAVNSTGIHSRPGPGGANLRNYWLLGPEPLREQHYAAFPTEIPKRCILAGTSERGACPACGAPWARVVAVKGPDGRVGLTTGRHAKDADGRPVIGDNRHARGDDPWHASGSLARAPLHGFSERTTHGWQPGCACKADTCPECGHPASDHRAGSGCNDEGEWDGYGWTGCPCDRESVVLTPVPCVVLDPFSGSGTTALVANRLGRDAIGIDLNSEYCEMSRQRIAADAGSLFGDAVTVEPAPTQLELIKEAM
jgi:site-specific DNA-methyltransferase (cytosine-N4-specific)